MTKVTIFLAPRDVMREFSFEKEKLQLVRVNLGYYQDAGSFECRDAGEDAAEEAFDLTNNPSRQSEREEKYGRGRSVSSGDVIDVDGTKFVCMSCGWETL
jgi:hypothetical protein